MSYRTNIPIRLKEWILTAKTKNCGPGIYKVLIEVWDRFHGDLLVLPSPLMSFFYHEKFFKATQETDFSEWMKCEMDRFVIQNGGQCLDIGKLAQRVKASTLFQRVQVVNVIRKVNQHKCLETPLSDTEKFLKTINYCSGIEGRVESKGGMGERSDFMGRMEKNEFRGKEAL